MSILKAINTEYKGYRLCSLLSGIDLIMYLFRGNMGLVPTFPAVSITQFFMYIFV